MLFQNRLLSIEDVDHPYTIPMVLVEDERVRAGCVVRRRLEVSEVSEVSGDTNSNRKWLGSGF